MKMVLRSSPWTVWAFRLTIGVALALSWRWAPGSRPIVFLVLAMLLTIPMAFNRDRLSNLWFAVLATAWVVFVVLSLALLWPTFDKDSHLLLLVLIPLVLLGVMSQAIPNPFARHSATCAECNALSRSVREWCVYHARAVFLFALVVGVPFSYYVVLPAIQKAIDRWRVLTAPLI